MASTAQLKDPYEEPTPYDVLGLPPEATAVQLRDRYNELVRKTQEAGGKTENRARRLKELDEAYNQLRVAAQRVRVDFRLLDPKLGVKECEKIAAGFATPDTNIAGLIKPRTIRVAHVTLLSEIARFTAEPAAVLGLHPRTISVADQEALPPLLAIQYDC